ncbi:PRC-barrel domain-containing protein [Sphingomonas japonica]|uniref:PRC-barrel domain-containing protein n=1 Tax=Sphingomonas japonica TaxID=511662 RepID=A0ABX0U018_9SPHN|nr:PRC-barrel domain-containing protein [Sphingomonas japonica]NIJ22969.1 hypothetical protein [Sphingomonas japonica]
MVREMFWVSGMAIFAAACSDGPPAPDGTEIVRNGVVMAEDAATASDVADATATGPGTAFGLTADQIDDAELVDGSDAELGEIEHLLIGADGAVVGLIAEIGETDRDVQVPLTGLRAVKRGGDWDLVTTMTAEQLLALPNEDAPLAAGVTVRR